MGTDTPSVVKPAPEEILPVFQEVFCRPVLKNLIKENDVKLYRKILTPPIILRGSVFQRLNRDHTADAFASHPHSGSADRPGPYDSRPSPLSRRLSSESSPAYIQGRNRIPLSVLRGAFRPAVRKVSDLPASPENPSSGNIKRKGTPVRLSDGTTFRLPPFGDLPEESGQAGNQSGKSYRAAVRSATSFRLYTRAAPAHAEGGLHISETSPVCQAVMQDAVPDSICAADRGSGICRTARTASCYGHPVLLRPETKTAERMLRETVGRTEIPDRSEVSAIRKPGPKTVTGPDLPAVPVPGRLISARPIRPGFRPVILYFFTTLSDPAKYSVSDIAALYGMRRNAEPDCRHVKTASETEYSDVKPASVFRKEPETGLPAYNLICAVTVRAAPENGLSPFRPGFSQCLRRLRTILCEGIPGRLREHCQSVTDYILKRLSKCRLPYQPDKVRSEPGKIRRRPEVFPSLKGERNDAGKQIIPETGI